MKNIAIAIPPAGASVQLILRAGASSGQVVIVASDDVEIRYTDPAPATAPTAKSPPSKDNGKAPAHDLDTILKDRLIANESELDEDEDGAEVDDPRAEPGDRLQPKRPDEQLCSSCFLLVRAKAPGCPMDDDTCPIFT